MPAAKPKRITKIQYDRIDRVGSGAQPDAHITLVKNRKRIAKLIDPASLDARLQFIRDAFRDAYGQSWGCCSPCSGYVYIDATYDDFVIACDSDGEYWKFGYTIGGGDGDNDTDDITFDTPVNVTPSVTWTPEKDSDETPPAPIAKSKALWEATAAERMVRVTKWTDTPDNRKALAAMDPPQALSDGSYPMPTKDYVNKAIKDLGRAGSKRGKVISLIRARAKSLGMDLSDSSVPELSGKKSMSKEQPMPEAVKETESVEIDLSGLDEASRTQVEAALAERDALKAAAAATPAPPEEDEVDDLATPEGIEKAIKKSRSPETKRILKAMHATAVEAAQNRETTARLQKAERIRLFKERAGSVRHMAAHAGDAGTDTVGALAGLLETIDDKAGSDVAEQVEALLTKANSQVHDLMDKKGLLKSVGRGEADIAGGVAGAATLGGGDPEAEVDELATALIKETPSLTMAQARTRVLKARPELYAKAMEQAR